MFASTRLVSGNELDQSLGAVAPGAAGHEREPLCPCLPAAGATPCDRENRLKEPEQDRGVGLTGDDAPAWTHGVRGALLADGIHAEGHRSTSSRRSALPRSCVSCDGFRDGLRRRRTGWHWLVGLRSDGFRDRVSFDRRGCLGVPELSIECSGGLREQADGLVRTLASQ